jgi:glucan-binding YG repeat protein
MKTGWYKVGSNWYYSNPSGVMRYSTWIGDYYLLGDGRMATNRWVGGYYVGADGKWVR